MHGRSVRAAQTIEPGEASPRIASVAGPERARRGYLPLNIGALRESSWGGAQRPSLFRAEYLGEPANQAHRGVPSDLGGSPRCGHVPVVLDLTTSLSEDSGGRGRLPGGGDGAADGDGHGGPRPPRRLARGHARRRG